MIKNIIICGVGGQGILTLGRVIGWASVYEGLDCRVAEVHGLAQRGGSLSVHVRIGHKVYSPLIPLRGANIVIALEGIELLRNLNYVNESTLILLNNLVYPPASSKTFASLPEVLKELKKYNFHVNLKIVEATNIAVKLGDARVANIVMLGYLLALNALPLSKESILKALRNVIKTKYLEINIRALNEGFKLGKLEERTSN